MLALEDPEKARPARTGRGKGESRTFGRTVGSSVVPPLRDGLNPASGICKEFYIKLSGRMQPYTVNKLFCSTESQRRPRAETDVRQSQQQKSRRQGNSPIRQHL